jgi:N-acylneuraminate cytidylyltransferase
MYYSEKGDELKKFNTKDGMGVAMLRENGIKFGIITGEKIGLVQRRALKVKADECHIGISNKMEVLDDICARHGLKYDEIAYIGDDRNDTAVIETVGFGCSVADGMAVAQNAAVYITKAKGGEGAIREVAELILANKK